MSDLMPEPADHSVVLLVHRSGTPENAWLRDDTIAAETDYGNQHWYRLGHFGDEGPESWGDLLRACDLGTRVLVVTGTEEVGRA